MITLTIPPDKIDAVRKAAADDGINLTGDHGTAEIRGVKIGYSFDGHDLDITILHKPFFVTERFIEKLLRERLEDL